MKPFIIISYYTKDTPYKAEAMKLAFSLEVAEVAWFIEEVPNLGSWQKNTHYKATFIKRMLDKFKGKNLVFVDADAIVQRYPKLFDTLKCDLGLVKRDYKLFPTRGRKEGKETLSGTLYIANNARVRKFVDRWIAINNIEKRWEQLNLDQALQEWNGKLKIKEMPPAYCQIHDWMKSVKNPVVTHFQASRKYRFRVNREYYQ